MLKLSVCVYLNILLKTVILNYSTTWLLAPTLSKNCTITRLYYVIQAYSVPAVRFAAFVLLMHYKLFTVYFVNYT